MACSTNTPVRTVFFEDKIVLWGASLRDGQTGAKVWIVGTKVVQQVRRDKHPPMVEQEVLEGVPAAFCARPRLPYLTNNQAMLAVAIYHERKGLQPVFFRGTFSSMARNKGESARDQHGSRCATLSRGNSWWSGCFSRAAWPPPPSVRDHALHQRLVLALSKECQNQMMGELVPYTLMICLPTRLKAFKEPALI